MADRDRHESFEETKFGIGQNTDGTFNVFPLTQLAAKTAARDAAEAEGLEEQGDVDELADEYKVRLGGEDSKPTGDEWNEADHPRGQPGNAGQFGSGGGGGQSKKEHASRQDKQAEAINYLESLSGKSVPAFFPVASQELEDGLRAKGVDASAIAQRAVEETVQVSSLKTFQSDNSKSKLLDMIRHYDEDDQDRIIVIRYGGDDYVWDGNHRAMAAYLSGERTIQAKVLSVGKNGVE